MCLWGGEQNAPSKEYFISPFRAENCLRLTKVKTIGGLIQISRQRLLSYRGFGRKTLEEIEIKLKEGWGLSLHNEI